MKSDAEIARLLEESLQLKLPPIAVSATNVVPDGVPLNRGQVGKFHRLRRLDIEAGGKPTVNASLARLAAAG